MMSFMCFNLNFFVCSFLALCAANNSFGQHSNAKNDLETKKATTDELIRHLLDQDLGIRKFPFPDVVFASSGKKVIPFEKSKRAHQETLTAVTKAADAAIQAMNRNVSPVRELRRINEASQHFENHLLKSIQTHPSLTCSIPKNSQGNEQRSGYPDLLIAHTANDGKKTYFYLDPKLYEKKSRASSLRTFYFEPRTRTNKIQYDAVHLLIGISHDGNEGKWQFLTWEVCDLHQFQVRLKAEFQASNRDLYRPNIIVKSSNPEHKLPETPKLNP
jgi:hypothetical protein